MNLQPGRIGSSGIAGVRRRRNSDNTGHYGVFMLKFLMVIIAFMAVLVGHLYLRQQSVKSAERTDDIKKQINEIKAENRNLRNRIEGLTTLTHVNRMIARFKLDLRPAMYGQIINIGVYTPEQAANIPLKPLKVASNSDYSRHRR